MAGKKMRRTWRKAKPKEEKIFRSNNWINAPSVCVIGETGEQLGVMPIAQAKKLAEEAFLDLVEVNPKAEPPIVKIMDFGQFKYEREKKSQKQKAEQKKVDTKGIRLSFRISDHDFNIRADQAVKFIARGDKLKVELILKGREKQHETKAAELLMNFVKKVGEKGQFQLEQEDLTKQNGRYSIILVNKK
ncbi:translation initiation factor IF-3 [Candidatus Falkowbacteria bacterium CG_4_10_14_0_2_um_filter_48_10]|uniref:Translation initiation factor IF-3 n=1 Tax=Candidatus Falkowbacteria bacterium CG23_combo_of_CG06-09_8_20_14_all_49_15 TaxID=1974572 RepID=A0A2G9ZMQ3_9BACT|nr:MAG: translation initiation factor IF-3 [Candidatus Falkowbacteria bacterium CG23_combo_of_CG06-09_8_20_14_all_49_15]PJA07773.1 MAG: translation initiation factor IF-3 [Candidatus Falkowbacteria bacterium CG_4_10_14_0_2_um_filter_48_10]